MSNGVNVVVLAAGLGQRFSGQGIDVPKPLIHFRGRSLLERSLDVAKEITHHAGGGRIIVVGTMPVARAAFPLLGLHETRRIVEVSVTQPGPAASGALALAHLQPSTPVVFMDCDNFYPEAQRGWARALPLGDFFMTTFRLSDGADSRQFCSVAYGPDMHISGVQEKSGALRTVGTGLYGFPTAADFRGLYTRLSAEPRTTELPMSALIDRAVREAEFCSVLAVEVPAWAPIGTPEQLAEAEKHVP